MNITRLTCPSCGAALTLPEGSIKSVCNYCGGEIVIDSAQMAEMSKSVTETGVKTQEVIKSGTDVTQYEIRRLQLTQELSMIQMQLTSLKTEKRSLLSVGKPNKSLKAQLSQIEEDERSLLDRQKLIQSALIGQPIANEISTRGLGQAQPHNQVFVVPPPALAGPTFPQRSETTTVLLAAFLGIFGAHRFYTGHKGLGWLYLFTAGIGGMGWAVDIFLLFTNNYKDKFGRSLIHNGTTAKLVLAASIIGFILFMSPFISNPEVSPPASHIFKPLIPFAVLFGIKLIVSFFKKQKEKSL